MKQYVSPEAIKETAERSGVIMLDQRQADVQIEPPPFFDPWQTYPVQCFPMDVLPQALRRFVEFQERSIGADPAAIAMAALAACSGALDHAFALKMQEHGDWGANPRLWVLLVGAPSTKKTPILTACLKPIRAVEREAERQHQKDLAIHEAAKDRGEKPVPVRPAVRYIANDVTPEKLGEILSRQNRGILVEQDELSGWIGSMDKYVGGGKGSAANRAFWLTANNGGPKHIDRIGRGSIYIENCSVSLIGGIQPGRLAEIGNLTSDGLLQRFLPVMMNPALLAEDTPDDGAIGAYSELLTALTSLRGCRLNMTPGALTAAKVFRRWSHEIQGLMGLGDSFCSFIGKLDGVHGSLALILHLASDPDRAMYAPVEAHTVEAAGRILQDFIVPHALALYQQSTDTEDWDRLRALASFVLTSSKDRFTASDFTTNVRHIRGLGTWDVAQKISPLVAGGWLSAEATTAPPRAWRITPGLRERFAARCETELVRKADALAILQSLQRGGGE